MRRPSSLVPDSLRLPILMLVAACVLIGASGPNCDSDAAATFRQEATAPIGQGVKTIMNGVLDGLIAAVQEAGDGSGDSGSSRR